MSELSKITIITPILEYLDNPPKYFNLDWDAQYPLRCFIAPNVELNDDYNYVSYKIAHIFDTHPEVECVYTDNISVYNGIEHRIYYPSASFNVCDKININTPICCRTRTEIRFNENLEHLYYMDFLKKMSKIHVTWHIPLPLFKIHIPNNQSIERDLKIMEHNEQGH